MKFTLRSPGVMLAMTLVTPLAPAQQAAPASLLKLHATFDKGAAPVDLPAMGPG
jgi:hypothetical protein